ncbi:unnamed protein product [Fusarium venenatum]|uniref:Uncharacterized protein n=1 Tax=Fusarium venenatum TaxID=56646 RepID=A0A2L2T5V4_9HYPO|nr:uncharacterized protein FVRRES_04887 [Fusarium venenatum]CEI60451.1 unnamed protein product [Fusarium venenatum]
MSAPKLVTWDDNYRLMVRLFDAPLTHVLISGRPEPRTDFLQQHALAVNREVECDTCRYIGFLVKCRPASIPLLSYTMNLAQLLTVSYAPKPLSESLFQPADDEEGEEGEVDDEMDDAMEENDDE